MELPDPIYLYTLATVAMTYAALSMIFVFFRQIRGGVLTIFEVFIARNFLHLSFIVVTGSLLPPLLAHLALPPWLIWRLASAITAGFVIEHVITTPIRRRKITNVKNPPAIIIASVVLWISALSLTLNIVGMPNVPSSGLFSLGVTLPLFVAIWQLLRRVNTLLSHPEDDFDPKQA
ncbi:hypothetical protein [Paracraurococcus lichenis]|uniref:Uncharacterized protein n=1 Tax=Paracraurococcus lichenis TaxID=3064888 RepID=A0ABT9E839_9PROT|nr:hypothetical protein [Paracraurococcus sp. LOR1-02]MDO9712376.1 hypothetical protein [Paracraurococcus sp. LOR1-02]